MDYDLDSETRMHLFEERQKRLAQQRLSLGQTALWLAALSLVIIIAATAGYIAG